MLVAEPSECFCGIILVEISLATNTSPTLSRKLRVGRSGGGGVGLSKRPLSAADWLKLPSLSIHAQSDSFFLKSTKLILILTLQRVCIHDVMHSGI